MKLLLTTKTEIQQFNLQYLLKSQVIFAHSYEEFLSKLHVNIDCVGFTSKAISLISTSSEFIPRLEGIRVMYDYKFIYFTEDDTDLIATYLNKQQNAFIAPRLSECSEVDILKQLDRDEIKTTRPVDIDTIDANKIPQVLNRLEMTPDRLINEFKESPKLLRDILTVANNVHVRNGYLTRQNSDLQSQKIYLLELANKISDNNDKLVETVKTLEEINNSNYTSLCNYKNIYDEYQSVLDDLLKHGVSNTSENIVSSIHVDNTTYPVCIVYFKQITHLSYFSTYLESLLQIMLDKNKIAKLFRILPKNSTTKLVKYQNYFNTTYGVNALTYSSYHKFVHLGNPHTILEYISSNQMPIDVLFIIDETDIDNQYCYGDSVIRYNIAHKDTDILEYDLDIEHSIVNRVIESNKPILLPHYDNFEKIQDSEKLVQVYNESLPLTQILTKQIDDILKAMEEVI